MRSIVRLVFSFVLFTVACGGDSKLPTAPSPLTALPPSGAQRMPVSAAEVPFTLGVVAPTLGNEINATFLAAMVQGVPASAGTSLNKLMREAIDAVIGVKVQAQSGFTQRCTRSGTVTVRHSGSTSGGTATLSNTEVIFSSCAYEWNNRMITFHATLRATGTFRVSRPADPIHLEGDIRVDELGGPFLLNGDTGPFLNGTITPAPGATGGTPGVAVPIGTPVTPTTPGGTTPAPAPPTTPGAPPSITPPPTSGTPTANVTGTWGVDGQPSLSFVQNGGALTGQFLWPDIPVPGIVVISNGLSGVIDGNNLVFGGKVTIQGGDSEIGYITVEVITTAQLSLSGSTLSGSWDSELRPTCTGLMKEFCLPPSASHPNVTLTRIGTVQSGTYDLSGRWAGAEMIQLQQDGGGGLSGSVIAGDISEQSVSGRNDSNRVSLRVRYTTRENTSSVDYSRTIDRSYELTAYEPSSVGGFLTTVTTERCTAKNSTATAFCADRNKTERTAGNASLMRR